MALMDVKSCSDVATLCAQKLS